MTAAQEMAIVTGGFEQTPAVDIGVYAFVVSQLLEASGFRECLRMQTWA